MLFIILLALTTISIAGIAAFFSVYGLAQIFQGTFVAVLIMGGALEAGKLVATSFLYRYWDQVGWFMKTYLISAVLLLMVITSMGIFGMLSTGYQSDTISLKDTEVVINLLEQEQQQLITRKREIDAQIASLPSNSITGRQRLMKSFDPEVKIINKRLPEISTEIKTLNTKLIQVEAHVGPIVYIAKAMGESVDDATKYMILLIIAVFDPLAVVLTVGVNIALRQWNEDKEKAKFVSDDRTDTITPPQEDTAEAVERNVVPEQQPNTDETIIVDLVVDNDVSNVLTLSSDDIRELIADEVGRHTNPAEIDPVVAEMSRKNQIISDIRRGTLS